MAEVEYVILERLTLGATGADTLADGAEIESGAEVWREVNRVTAARKAVMLHNHTPEQNIFNALPASDWDAMVEVGTEQVPKRTVTSLRPRATRRHTKKESVAE